MSDRYILLIDESKYFVTLPFLHDITCEVLKEAYSYVSRKIKEMGGELILRPSRSKAGPVISDDGHFIVDVHFDIIENIKDSKTIFFKASRSMKFEEIINYIKENIK